MRIIELALVGVLLTAGCSGDSGDDAAAPDVTGVYACSIEAVDDRVICGGPVYRTNLAGQALSLSVAQTGQALEAGMWGRVLTGTVDAGGHVVLQYTDDECDGLCSPSRPFIIDVTGIASARQIADIDVRMHQESIDECLKTYRGICATN